MFSLLWTRYFRILSLSLLCSACATQAPRPVPVDQGEQAARRQALLALDAWQVHGRIAVRAENEGWSAGFDWRQADPGYRIQLRGPFGRAALELKGDARGVWLTRAGQPAVFATGPEMLLYQQSGWRLPVTGLAYWLRGVPDNRSRAISQRDVAGRLTSLQQGGWQIDYSEYQRYGDYDLPTRLVLERENLRVKVLIDRWEFP